MKVDFIWVTNYKSIQNRNKIKINPSVTVVIGRNESGKSNLIDILGSISLKNGLPDDVYLKTPQDLEDARISIEVECSFTEEEIKGLNLKSCNEKSNFFISQEYSPLEIAFSGGIQEYFKNIKFQNSIKYIEGIIEKYKSAVTHTSIEKKIQNDYKYLAKAPYRVIPKYKVHINSLKKALLNLLSPEDKEKLDEECSYISTYISNVYTLLPRFYKYSENLLSSQYIINDDFLKKDTDKLRSLKTLIEAAGCSIEDIEDACINHPHDGRGMKAKERIKGGIINNIEVGFNQFYQQEESVKIIVDISKSRFSVYIETEGPILPISERSQGLEWYLNMYIDIIANNLEEENVVLLIDEPGVYLHVDAQKKVLELFDKLSKETQIVYTTHSPFMLNENRLDGIRTIQKNQEGNSEIITSVLSEKIIGSSKSESLSPLINSLGMKVYQNIGMSETNMNIITEGHSDAIYLDAMSKRLGIRGMKFIPSIGASKSVYLTNILWAWGFSFKALFDWDKAGRDGRKSILKAYASDPKSQEAKDFEKASIVMISDVFSDDKKDITYTIESLIDDVDYKKINPSYSYEIIQKEEGLKMFFSNAFADAVTKNEIELSSETIDNFERLFEKLRV